MKKAINKLFNIFNLEISRYKPNLYEKTVSLKTEKKPKGNVLLSYILEPFLLDDAKLISNAHTHDWESYLMARTFLDLGYNVDVVDYRNATYKPQKDYIFFVSARTNFQRISKLLNKDCIKIVHLETSHWLFNNTAAFSRCLALQDRRGIALKSLKWVEPNWAIECADFATIKGNQFTKSTYDYAHKKIFLTPNPANVIFSSPEKKNYEKINKNFLWFGSKGLVHKGLDLVLEAISEMPDYSLYICGPIQQEKEFKRAYYKELYQSPNIHTIGWVDVNGSEFKKIINNCVALVYPSCAEGQAGSVINCMQSGLIPILSYESGVDVHDFGVLLKDCSIEEIKKTIIKVAEFPAEIQKQMALKASEFAKTNHNRETFQSIYTKTIMNIIEKL